MARSIKRLDLALGTQVLPVSGMIYKRLTNGDTRSQGPGCERVRVCVCGEKGARATTSLSRRPNKRGKGRRAGDGYSVWSAQTSMRRRRIRGPNLFGGEAQDSGADRPESGQVVTVGGAAEAMR